MAGDDHGEESRKAGGIFPQTRWSLIAAVQNGDDESATQALGQVCEAYWHPLYAFARRSGRSKERAEDLVQSFFESLISRSSMERVDPGKGKLRSFFLASFKKHITNVWRRDTAQKRGGGSSHLSLDADLAEQLYRSDVRKELTPEQMFDRRWALTLIDRVMDRLGETYRSRGHFERFEVLRDFMEPKGSDGKYATAAERIGLSENAFQQAVFRLRAKYRELLEDEIAETVGSRDDVQAELRQLIAVLGN